jgi:hypothetical protein
MILDLINVYPYRSLLKKIHPKVLPITLVLKYICKFSKFYDGYYFVINIFHMFRIFNVTYLFLKIKLIKYIFKTLKWYKMWCSYAQKINCKKIILETTTFRVLMCFPLRNQFCKNGMNYLLLCLGLEIWFQSTQIHHHQTPLNKEFSTYKHHPSNISLKENLQYLSFVVWIKSNNETCIKN